MHFQVAYYICIWIFSQKVYKTTQLKERKYINKKRQNVVCGATIIYKYNDIPVEMSKKTPYLVYAKVIKRHQYR